MFVHLYGTGFHNVSSLAWVSAEIGGIVVPVVAVVADQTMPGRDVITLGPLPAGLAGLGLVDVAIMVENIAANRVSIFMGDTIPSQPVGHRRGPGL